MNYGKRGVRSKQRALNSKGKKIKRKFALGLVKLVLFLVIGVGICVASAGIGLFKGILNTTPQIRLSDVVAVGEATIVYDAAGNEIDQYVSTNSNRIQINDMDKIPKHLQHAFVAAEDKRFYEHNGIDFVGMLRAGFQFIITAGDETQGASTITQQLIKNTIFTDWTSEGNNWIKKIKRKIQEQYLAMEVSKYYSKDDVLLRYMNAINLGQNTLGIESASQRYFGKSCSELTLSESAVIACITQNPSGYNPIRFPENNAKRRKTCLDTMLECEFITKAEYDEAIADTDAVYERIGLHDTDYRLSTNATAGSYFSDAVYEAVRDDLVNEKGYTENMAETLLTSGGLRIHSTMDPTIQKIADEEFANPENYPDQVNWYLNYALSIYIDKEENVTKNFSKENMMSWFQANKDKKFNLIFNSQDAAYEAIDTYRAAMMEELGVENIEDNYVESISMTAQPQAALVFSDQETGYVLAMVGGRGVKEGRRTLNRATDALRSPGSTFKIIAAYAPALDSVGLTLSTVYNDAAFNYTDGKPVSNWYKTGYRGIQSIRTGIEDSLNIIAVKTLTAISPRLGFDYAKNFGFTTLVEEEVINNKVFTDIKQPLALGGLTHGVSPYELNAAYASIANLGSYVEPTLYTIVTDAEGNVLLDHSVQDRTQVIKETTAYLLTDAMVDVVTKGTGTRCNFDKKMAIAGKTGTSSDYHDVWFAGYTPYYTCTVWAGYDNNIEMSTRDSNNESAIAKDLWRAVMERVHENLPDEAFYVPEGIEQVTVCSRSGLLPIPGLCDATLTNEIYDEFTVPMMTCNIHYQGPICHYEGMPASAECPFQYQGIMEVPLLEDPTLIEGSTMIIENPDGTTTVSIPRQSNQCQHNAAFFANPDYEAIINAQQWEINQRYQPAPQPEEEEEW